MPILRLRPNAETRAREYLIDAEVRDNSGVIDHVAFAHLRGHHFRSQTRL